MLSRAGPIIAITFAISASSTMSSLLITKLAICLTKAGLVESSVVVKAAAVVATLLDSYEVVEAKSVAVVVVVMVAFDVTSLLPSDSGVSVVKGMLSLLMLSVVRIVILVV